MKRIIELIKELGPYWFIIGFDTIIFELVGISRYYNGGYDFSNQFIINQTYDLWIWGTMTFVLTLVIGLMLIPKMNRKFEMQWSKEFEEKYNSVKEK